jgi:hypothetical protein
MTCAGGHPLSPRWVQLPGVLTGELIWRGLLVLSVSVDLHARRQTMAGADASVLKPSMRLEDGSRPLHAQFLPEAVVTVLSVDPSGVDSSRSGPAAGALDSGGVSWNQLDQLMGWPLTVHPAVASWVPDETEVRSP